MLNHLLLPHNYRKIGWIIFIPTAIIGIFTLFIDFEPDFLDLKVPALFIDQMVDDPKFIGMVTNNLLNELLAVAVIISMLMIAFSRESIEDEYLSKIRLEALVWAVYINYAILLFCILFIYDFSFFRIMIFNLFTVLFIFIIRYNWLMHQLNKANRL